MHLTGEGQAALDAWELVNAPTVIAGMRPVWLLDVDGVLNANRPGWGAAPRSGMAYAGGMGFKIRWAPALANRIRIMHRSGLVEIRWATTWCPWAGQIENLLALPALGRAFDGEVNGTAARLAKYAAAQQVLAEGRRLIWTDDDAIPADGPDREALAGALLIAPSPRRGLQPEDLDAIEKFIANDATEEQS
jgi:hypothetical protein